MWWRIRFLFVIFYFTAISMFTIGLRNANNRTFYRLYSIQTEQGRLKQQLWQKQLRLESLINPAAISKKLEY